MNSIHKKFAIDLSCTSRTLHQEDCNLNTCLDTIVQNDTLGSRSWDGFSLSRGFLISTLVVSGQLSDEEYWGVHFWTASVRKRSICSILYCNCSTDNSCDAFTRLGCALASVLSYVGPKDLSPLPQWGIFKLHSPVYETLWMLIQTMYISVRSDAILNYFGVAFTGKAPLCFDRLLHCIIHWRMMPFKSVIVHIEEKFQAFICIL